MTEQEKNELNGWIAEHVMGWKWRLLNPNDTVNCLLSQEEIKNHPTWEPHAVKRENPNVPNYCADPTAAMEVLEKCLEESPLALVKNKTKKTHSVGYLLSGGDHKEDQSLPLAICLFARQLFSK